MRGADIMRAFFERTLLEERSKSQMLVSQISECLSACLPLISQKYGVKRSILFGSYAGKCPDRESDIDIYVEPLQDADYWVFAREIERIIGIHVDLYTQNDEAEFVRIVKAEGKEIYG